MHRAWALRTASCEKIREVLTNTNNIVTRPLLHNEEVFVYIGRLFYVCHAHIN